MACGTRFSFPGGGISLLARLRKWPEFLSLPLILLLPVLAPPAENGAGTPYLLTALVRPALTQ